MTCFILGAIIRDGDLTSFHFDLMGLSPCVDHGSWFNSDRIEKYKKSCLLRERKSESLKEFYT